MSIIDQQKYYCLFFLFNSNLYVHHRFMKVPFPQYFHFYVQHMSTKIILSFFYPIFIFMSNIDQRKLYSPFFPQYLFMSNIDYLRFYVQHRNAIIVLSHMFGYTFYVQDRSTRIELSLFSTIYLFLCQT